MVCDTKDGSAAPSALDGRPVLFAVPANCVYRVIER